jgi:P27 family predicted phage terminase small subunit
MRRGPKPKPSTIEALAAQQQDLGPLIKPAWLSKQDAKVWDELAPFARGVKSGDSAGFADLCVCVRRVRQLEKRLDREGMILKSKQTGTRKNPASQILREYRTAIQRWLPEYGLTPSSGTKIGLLDPGQSAIDRHDPPGLLSGQFQVTQ